MLKRFLQKICLSLVILLCLAFFSACADKLEKMYSILGSKILLIDLKDNREIVIDDSAFWAKDLGFVSENKNTMGLAAESLQATYKICFQTDRGQEIEGMIYQVDSEKINMENFLQRAESPADDSEVSIDNFFRKFQGEYVILEIADDFVSMPQIFYDHLEEYIALEKA